MRFKGSVPRQRIAGALAALSMTALAVTMGAVPALASTASVAVSAGTLAFVSTPGNPSLSSITLNGTDQTSTGTLPMDVGDNRGSGAGWNISMTSTTFSTGGLTPQTLSTNATTVSAAPSDSCDASVTCTVATNAITYPYALPAATLAPTATKLFDAAANTGMANQTVTPTFRVAVPANTFVGTYSSTWTISLSTGP